jgi:hypothetical protein
MKRWSHLLVAACLGVSGCRAPDLSPADTVKGYEDDVSRGEAGRARALLTVQQAKEADTLFRSVLAEEHNRRNEGVVSEQRSTEMTGESAHVVAVYVMKDGIRRTYTWELLREEGRWRVNNWEAEVEGGRPQ